MRSSSSSGTVAVAGAWAGVKGRSVGSPVGPGSVCPSTHSGARW